MGDIPWDIVWARRAGFNDLNTALLRFRAVCLRRRGHAGRYWARRRVPSSVLKVAAIERRELARRGGGLFRLVRWGDPKHRGDVAYRIL
jgi:hypothetical protein